MRSPWPNNQHTWSARRAATRPGDDLRARAATTGSVCCGGRRDAFVEELNRRLRADPAFRGDTAFVVEIDAGGRVVATTWQGPEAMKPVIARIVKGVIGEYECGQPFVYDR